MRTSSRSAGSMLALGRDTGPSGHPGPPATMGVVVAPPGIALGLLDLGAVESTVPSAATAHLTGVRHSYDWDHLATIDDFPRRFEAQDQVPVSVGRVFRRGHSSVVLDAGALAVAGASFPLGLRPGGDPGQHPLRTHRRRPGPGGQRPDSGDRAQTSTAVPQIPQTSSCRRPHRAIGTKNTVNCLNCRTRAHCVVLPQRGQLGVEAEEEQHAVTLGRDPTAVRDASTYRGP